MTPALLVGVCPEAVWRSRRRCHRKGFAGTAWPASGGRGSLRSIYRRVHGRGGRTLAAGKTTLCGFRLAHTPPYELLDELVAQAPDGPVDLDWLLATWTNDRSGFCCCCSACW